MSRNLFTEKAIRKRKCYECKSTIEPNEFCIKIYINNKSRSFCTTCVSIVLVKAGVCNLEEVAFEHTL